jgi:hypothetical protein
LKVNLSAAPAIAADPAAAQSPLIAGAAQRHLATFPLKGLDTTIGLSGACGYNKQPNVRLPFTLTPVG